MTKRALLQKLQSGWESLTLSHSLKTVLLKSACASCQRVTLDVLCTYCHRQLHHQQLTDSNFKALGHMPAPLFAWGSYGGALKRVIAALKYQNQRQLGPFLGELLATVWLSPQRQQLPWAQQLPPKLWVVPIPLHPEKLQQRGFNQADLIARGFCRVTRLPLLSQALIRQRATTPQFGLTETQRQQNLQQAFALGADLPADLRRSAAINQAINPAVNQAVKQRHILLLDDIFTTGATIAAATETLTQAGFLVVGTVTVAYAPKS
jgi:ComF family protein